MAEPLISVRGLTKSFGGIVATNALDMDVRAGEIHAVIGPNGAGKTTLVAQLAGQIRPGGGTIHFDGADITHLSAPARSARGLARSFQITSVFPDLMVLDNVALAVQAHDGHSYRFWARARADERLRRPAREMLERVGLAHRSTMVAGTLAHGEQRQLEIAMVLATGPKALLLDEPMAGMGGEDSERMTAFLDTLKGDYTMLLVEHDMDAVFALADRITVLVYGQAIATGVPKEIRANERVRQAYLGED
jgi:branched-chain amino acid transport system ATP-binding protein